MRRTKHVGFTVWTTYQVNRIREYIYWHRADMDRKYMDNELKSKLHKK